MQHGELLFFGGIGIMSVTAVLAVVAMILQHFSGRKLRKRLDEEFGAEEYAPRSAGRDGSRTGQT